MKIFGSKYFIVLAMLYIVVLLLKRNGVLLPFLIQGYFTDILCLPVALSFTLGLIRVIKNDNKILLTPLMIVVAWFSFSILFEWILPQKSNIYRADIFDVVAYLLGGFGFYLLQFRYVDIKNIT